MMYYEQVTIAHLINFRIRNRTYIVRDRERVAEDGNTEISIVCMKLAHLIARV